MRVIKEYRDSHHYVSEWEKTELFCPKCGKQEVWNEHGPGDFYDGTEYMCAVCGTSASLDLIHEPDEDSLKIKEQLASGKTATPKTPLGC